MTKNILILADGSDYTGTALEYGIYITERLDAKLTVLYREENLDERVQSALNKAGKRCRKAGLDFQLKKVRKVDGEVIAEEAKDADWVFLPQKGEQFNWSSDGLLGSQSEVVISKSDRPVLVIPVSFEEIESMGLAYDGSSSADNALKIAAELSDKIRWPLSIIIVADDSDRAADLSKRIEELLDPYEEIDSDIVILGGKAEHEIIKFIKEGSVELMVMGAYGNSRLEELTLGSTASFVIRESTIPVLIIR
jgi:nucleotide-binding universal stress UspA family protein